MAGSPGFDITDGAKFDRLTMLGLRKRMLDDTTGWYEMMDFFLGGGGGAVLSI